MEDKLSKNNTAVENGISAPESTGDNMKLEDALKVVDAVTMSTDMFSKEVLTEFRKRSKAIKNSISKIDSSFETIAFNLHWINAKQAYKSDGYLTIVDYASDNFGYQKSTCYSLIAVVDRFARRDEKGALTESFDDRVKGYSVSKLSLMVNLTDAEIGSLNPSMSVRDIKKYVKSLESGALPDSQDEDGSPDGGTDTTTDGGVAVADSPPVSDIFTECFDRDDYGKRLKKIGGDITSILKRYPKAVVEVSYRVIQNNG